MSTRWNIIHLATHVDANTGDLILPDSSASSAQPNRLLVNGVVDLVRKCEACLVVVPTCDSIALAIKLANVTNVIAGHKPVEQVAALSWAKVFYENLSKGVPLGESYDAAQRQVDCGLVLLSRREFRLVSTPEMLAGSRISRDLDLGPRQYVAARVH